MEHGLSKTRLYSIYSGMKQRCYNPNNQHYQWYGAKGITICDEWMGENGLQNFIEWSLNHGYEEHLTINRKESDKGYSPDNCQWVTASVNSYRVSNKNFLPSAPNLQDSEEYSIIYSNNEQIIHEIKKLMIDEKTTQREVAAKLSITPQGLTKMLSKKNFGFEDAQKILSAMGYDLVLGYSKSQMAGQMDSQA